MGEWLPTLKEMSLLVLTREILFGAVHDESPSAGGCLWALPVGWFDGLAAILAVVEESWNWPDHSLVA